MPNSSPKALLGLLSGACLLVVVSAGLGLGEERNLSLMEASDVWVQRGLAAAEQQDWETAQENLRKFELAGFENPRAEILHAYVLYRLKKHLQAAQRFHDIAERRPESFSASYHLGQSLRYAGRYTRAIQWLKRCDQCTEHERDELWYPKVGEDHSGATSPKLVLQLAKAECLLAWGRALAAIDEEDRAKPILAEAITVSVLGPGQQVTYDTRARFAFCHAKALRTSRRYEEAFRALARFAEDFPGYPLIPDARYEAARTTQEAGNATEAISMFQALVEEYPEDERSPDSLVRILSTHWEAQNYSEAAEYCRLFLQGHPTDERRSGIDFKLALAYLLMAGQRSGLANRRRGAERALFNWEEASKEAKEALIQSAKHFEGFVERHTGANLVPSALYWAHSAYLKLGRAPDCVRMSARLVDEFPSSKWTKFLRRSRLPNAVPDAIAGKE